MCFSKHFFLLIYGRINISCYLASVLLFLWSNGVVVKVLDSQSGDPSSKELSGSKVDSAFHPSEADQTSTRNFWKLNGKK